MNSKKPRVGQAERNLLSVYISGDRHMPEIHSRRLPARSGPKRSIKIFKPQEEEDQPQDILPKNQLSSHTHILKNSGNESRLQKFRTFRSDMNRTKRMNIERRVPYIKSSLSPYLVGAGPRFIKQMLEKNKPVAGPTDSIKHSIYKYKQSNLNNVEVVLNNRRISSFSEKMEEFAVRSGFPAGSKFFISNSKDCFVKQELLDLGWIQNKVRESKYFHLKWVVNDIPSDYIGLDYSQRFNHFNNNKQLTNKNCLQKNIRKYNQYNPKSKILIPLSFDIQNQKERDLFHEEYDKQVALSILKQFIRAVQTKRPHYFQSLIDDKQLWIDMFLPKPPLNQQKIVIANSDLLQKQKDKGFMFEMKLLGLCFSYLLKGDDVFSRYTFSFYPNLWTSNSFSLSRMSNSIDYFEINSLLETPSELFMKQMFRLYVHYSQDPDFYSYGENNIWMAKSVGVSRGNGILLIKEKEKLLEAANIQKKFIQKYIENPLIFNKVQSENLKFVQGKKFDLRQWVLVKSLVPLQIYKFDRCYVRLCSDKYNKASHDYSNLKQHLTNYSQNKMYFDKKEESVISLEQLKLLLPENVYESQISPKIDSIIYKTLLSCQNSMTQNPSSFELYGFDIFISQNYDVWLLEVNLSPACQDRTEWMGMYLKQMTQGLINLVLDIPYPQTENDFKTHWIQLEPDTSASEQDNEEYQYRIQQILVIQRFWRMCKRRTKIIEYFNIE